MRVPVFVLVAAFLMSAVLGSQTPIFSPPPKPPDPAETPKPSLGPDVPVPTPAGSIPGQATADETTALFARLTQWPRREAKDAALVLAGLGAQVKERLLAGIAHNDWRVRSACAFALAEMREPSAIAPLRVALQDPSNKASHDEMFAAIVRIDPVAGPAAVLPFLAHSSGQVRSAAHRALPKSMDERHLPDLLELLRSRRGSVRATALDLLTRIPGARTHDEIFAAMADPEPRAAHLAAVHLARVGGPEVRARLLERASKAPLREAAYCMISLTLIEDLAGEPVVPDQGTIRNRAQALLNRTEDPFYAGAAACLLANLSYRSEDQGLRKLADDYLVHIILHAVAGGVFYSDYSSLDELCWQKLALLTGQDLGQNPLGWRQWWRTAQVGFVARRELRGLSEEDLKSATILLARQGLDGELWQAVFTGDDAALGDPSRTAPLVLCERARKRLHQALVDTHFFETRGELQDTDRLDGYTEIVVSRGAMRYRRFHHGPLPKDLRPLADLFLELQRQEAWQMFAPAAVSERAAYFARESTFFRDTEDAAVRESHTRLLGMNAYGDLAPDARKLVVNLLREASPEWIKGHQSGLAGLLKHEPRLSDVAAQVVRLLSEEPEPGVREIVLEVVASSGSVQSESILREFLDRQPMAGVVSLMNDSRAMVRAAAAESLVRFKEHQEVASLLLEGLKDYEPRVRDACLRSLSAMEDARVLAMLETILSGEDQGLRLRAIEALGVVGKEQAVPRLMEIYRGGDHHVRWQVIRALKEARGRRAVVALKSVVRDTGPLDLKKEAVDALVALGGSDVGQELQEILDRSAENEVKLLALSGLAQVMGERATPTILPYTEHQDQELKRIAVLTLARLGNTDALPFLLAYIEALEGDTAAERALEQLTFHVASDPSPPKRAKEHAEWAARFGKLSRPEWFLLGSRRFEAVLDDTVDWLGATQLEPAQFRALMTLLAKGNGPLRRVIDATLLRVSGLDLPPLSASASQAEVDERNVLYHRWLITK